MASPLSRRPARGPSRPGDEAPAEFEPPFSAACSSKPLGPPPALLSCPAWPCRLLLLAASLTCAALVTLRACLAQDTDLPAFTASLASSGPRHDSDSVAAHLFASTPTATASTPTAPVEAPSSRASPFELSRSPAVVTCAYNRRSLCQAYAQVWSG